MSDRDERQELEDEVTSHKGKALSWRVTDGVIELALHLPPCNEIGTAMLRELEEFITAFRELESSASALIIYSEQAAGFCAGADLRELYTSALPLISEDRAAGVRTFLERIHYVLNAIDSSPLTTIAAVHGVTFGGGFELALACDLIIADKMTRFCFPELRLGLIPGFGGIPRLQARFGQRHRARSVAHWAEHQRIEGSRCRTGQPSGSRGQVAARRAGRCRAGGQVRSGRERRSEAISEADPREELRREIDLFCELFVRPAVMEGLRKFVESTGAHPYLP